MSVEERLFLGGPLHGQRRGVQRDIHSFVVPTWPGGLDWYHFGDPGSDPPEESRVVYAARRAPSGRERVFVAPDYGYDTPEWWAFDTVDWVARLRPEVTGWEHLGEHWFWRGRPPIPPRSWLYVLADKRVEVYAGNLVTEELVTYFMGDVNSLLYEELSREIEYRLLPLCVVPGCDKKAPVVFTAAEDGRLAGRVWRRGQEIRLCPAHAHDVYRADAARSVEELADWLVPDAQVGWFDQFTARWDLSKGREPKGVRAHLLPLVDDMRMRLGERFQ